jgi:WD40 repeat protein
MSDVFISYSRRDIAFARLIREALQQSQIDTWIDWDRIPVGERWWQEIAEAIEGANVFMLIISRSSLGSKVCRDEIELALKNHKRIVPILVDQLSPEEIAGLAPDLPQFNWVVFERDHIFRLEVDPAASSEKAEDREVALAKLPQFEEALRKLSVAIHTDWEWVKYHTRLQVEALRWDNNGRDASYVVRGTALEEAEQQLFRAAGRDPQPTSLQVEYVTASRQEEARRQQERLQLERKARRRQRYVLAAVVIGLLVSSSLGVVAWGQRNQYLDEANARATAQAQTEQQRQVAVEQKQVADEQRNIAVSRQLAADAINQIDSQQIDEGMLLAIEATRQADTMDARNSLLRLILYTPQLRFIIAGHSDKVSGVAVSPDGKTVASASSDGTIGLWDTAAGKASHAPLKSTEGGFESVAFSPDGKYLATGEGGRSGSVGGQIVLWDVASGYMPEVLAPGGGAWVDALAFSRDGKTLAAGLANASAALYSVAGRKTVCPSIGKKVDNQVFDTIALSPDGLQIAFGTGGGDAQALSIWSTVTCQQVGQAMDTGKLAGFPGEGGWITGLAYSPDGKRLAVADGDYLLVLDTATWLPVRDALVIDSNFYIESLSYSPDGRSIALASKREVELLDANTGRQVGSQLLGPRGSVLSVAFGADGRSLAAGSSAGDVVVYDLQNEPLTTKVVAGTSSVSTVAFRPDGKVLASAGSDGVIRLWDTTTWQTIGQTPAGGGASAPLFFSPNGKVLASGGGDKLVHLWDAATGQQTGAPLDPKGGAVWCLAFSPNGKWLAVGGVTNQLSIWDVAGGKLVASHEYGVPMQAQMYDRDQAVRSVGFEPDSSGLFFTMGGGIARFVSWGAQGPGSDWTTREVTFTMGEYVANEIQGAMSPDGKTVALANFHAVRQYDVASGNMVGLPMYGHNNTVSSMAFSPDGRLLASGGMDSIVRLWDSATSQPVGLPLLGPSQGVSSLAFSPDGTRLVAVDGGGSIYVWDMVMKDWGSLACGLAGRNLSGLEWQQFMPDQPYRLTCPDRPIDSSGISQLTTLARTQQAAGRTEEARTIISDGLKWVVASPDGDANNAMCWRGSLDGFAAEVLSACERAVSLDPLPGFRDSRGLARALTGDTKGAIEDFQAFVDWSKQNGKYDPDGKQREEWIASLKQGKNPFDQKTLDSLRS